MKDMLRVETVGRTDRTHIAINGCWTPGSSMIRNLRMLPRKVQDRKAPRDQRWGLVGGWLDHFISVKSRRDYVADLWHSDATAHPGGQTRVERSPANTSPGAIKSSSQRFSATDPNYIHHAKITKHEEASRFSLYISRGDTYRTARG
jgi:hypothetical protein